VSSKSLKTSESRNLVNATGFSPADFPVGSPESRAIARMMVSQMERPPELTRAELDCLFLYRGTMFLTASTTPGYRELESTAAYALGREVSARRRRPAADQPSNASSTGHTWASLAFRFLNGRDPQLGDVLRFEDVARIAAAKYALVTWFIDAWTRELAHLPCPLQVDGERVFRRIRAASLSPRPRMPADDGFAWEEAVDLSATSQWRQIDSESRLAYAREAGITQSASLPHVEALVFNGIVDGRYRSTPLAGKGEAR